jgi:DNA (cytosine-5)-methyltransferase 1
LARDKKHRFIDLFAGIGGFHIGMEEAGGECVFVSEWDKFARQTYAHNFAKLSPSLFSENNPAEETQNFVGDITQITGKLDQDPDLVPDFDVMCGGFPCQPFSNAGLRKGLDEVRGTLFFDMLKILEVKIKQGRPAKAYFFENVRGLLSHMSGDKKTIDIIKENLENLGYSFHLYQVKASDYGVPQYRPRLFMIGFYLGKEKRNQSSCKDANSIFLELIKDNIAPKKSEEMNPTLAEILGGSEVDGGRKIGYTLRVGGRGSGIGDRRNWDTYNVDGQVIRINSGHGLKLQGFPSTYEFPDTVTEVQAMKQLGNSVAVPAIKHFAALIMKALDEQG